MRISTSVHTLMLLSLAGAVSLAAASPAEAQERAPYDDAKLATIGAILPDPELADMRGKFMRQNNVSFFGISLLTSWQDAQGITTNARLVFNVDFLKLGTDGKPTPALMVGWQREGDPAMDVTDTHSGYVPLMTPANVLPVGGIGTHQGAAQANVIAGANNLARNNMQIAIVPASAISALSMAGLQSADGTTNIGFADGDQLQFLAANNQIGIVMTGGDGLDSSLQSLGSDVGQMLQQTMLNTSGNSILNSASIILGADNFAQSRGVSLNSALSAMKGHGY
ncbi:hypothetical protein GRI44_12455 [Altererythrobacter confluentis]|uniref:Uncharacterized protein n=1 Tax=Allopontixanthobacter confluentis TaxID=1849021 RepID=A0A6L7GHL4_9SPHN|nr:hypothetical protein [Allopontixanthobacter confluentis]MXP15563.1 hypothetical protein [Allopontixanthobacter confluentis]